MRERIRFALFLAVLFSLAPMARAQQVKTTKVGDVLCTASYTWPDVLARGYFPVDVVLAHEGARDVVVRIEVQQEWGAQDLVTRRVTLGPGERMSFELLLRARDYITNEYNLHFEVGDEQGNLSGYGPGEGTRGTAGVVLYSTSGKARAGYGEIWSEAWTDHTSRSGWEISVMPSVFSALSPSWEAYSSLDLVVLDLTNGAPEAEILEAVLAWVRTGGRLLLHGEDLVTFLTEHSSAGSWLEERFEIEGHAGPWRRDARGRSRPCPPEEFRVFRCGHGHLVLEQPAGDLHPMEGAKENRSAGLVAFDLDLGEGWVPDTGGSGKSRMARALSLLSGFGQLPLRAYMALLVLFTLVIGPVNFIWVRRKKKPMLLLFTVPAIALVTSVGLVSYGILSEGLDVKVNTRSWSVLDQRESLASTAEVRRLFAGSSPGAGLRPERGTAVFPEEFRRWSHLDEIVFTQDLSDGRLLGGNYLEVRRPFSQLLLSDRTSRVRLEVRYAGELVEVSNALGTPVEALLLRSPDGEYHQLKGELAPGQGVRLAPAGGITAGLEWAADLKWILGDSASHLVPGTYLASISSPVLSDDCGIEVRELDGRHIVLGVLEGNEEAWR